MTITKDCRNIKKSRAPCKVLACFVFNSYRADSWMNNVLFKKSWAVELESVISEGSLSACM